MPIRVVLADDHPAFRAGVRAFLQEQPDIAVLGEASTGVEALQLAAVLHPDVLLLDLEMPGLTGLEVTRRLLEYAAPVAPVQVLILSAYEEQEYVFGALEGGAAGYLTKQESLTTIAEAIRGVAQGETGWLSRRIAGLFVTGHQTRQRLPPGYEALSEREREVLRRIALGQTNPEISAALFISESTVKKHVNAIYDTLDLKTRAQVVAWTWQHGLVRSGDTPG